MSVTVILSPALKKHQSCSIHGTLSSYLRSKSNKGILEETRIDIGVEFSYSLGDLNRKRKSLTPRLVNDLSLMFQISVLDLAYFLRCNMGTIGLMVILPQPAPQ